MPSINLRLSDEEHAALSEWAHGSRRSLQREIVFRLFAGGVLDGRETPVLRPVGAESPMAEAARPSSTPPALPDINTCKRGYAHHNYHAGKPCPHCGYPN